MCGLSCSLFMVVGCFTFLCCFCFLQQTFILYDLFYLISKGIFHIGGLVSKMHISIYVLLRNGSASVFCFFFAFIEYNLGIMNIQCIL